MIRLCTQAHTWPTCADGEFTAVAGVLRTITETQISDCNCKRDLIKLVATQAVSVLPVPSVGKQQTT